MRLSSQGVTDALSWERTQGRRSWYLWVLPSSHVPSAVSLGANKLPPLFHPSPKSDLHGILVKGQRPLQFRSPWIQVFSFLLFFFVLFNVMQYFTVPSPRFSNKIGKKEKKSF